MNRIILLNKKECIVGLFPSLFSGMKNLKKTGQLDRLVDYYLKPYAGEFKEVYYFSTFNELLEEYFPGRQDLPSIIVVPNRYGIHRWLYPFVLPFIHRKIIRKLTCVRIFQFGGIIPILIWKIMGKLPTLVTYGYHYVQMSQIEGRWILATLYRIIVTLGIKRVEGIIVTTEDIKNDIQIRLQSCGRSGKIVHLIPNGVDTEEFSPSENPPDHPRKVLLFVGRLEIQKNLELLLDAVCFIDKGERPLVKIIGNGSHKERLMQKAHELGLDIEFQGFVQHKELPNEFRKADLFVLPSHMEGQAKILLEAMSCGLPCIVSDCPGNRSVASHEVNALLFEPGNVHELATQVMRVINEHKFADQIGAQARRNMIEKHDIRTLVSFEIDTLYKIGTKQV